MESMPENQSSQMEAEQQRYIGPPDTVVVHPGSFVEVEENANGKKCKRLYVREDNLGDGYFRKYSKTMQKKRERWFCTQCNKKRNQRVNREKNYARDVKIRRSKEAIKSGNILYVSKTHASCKGFRLPIKEFSKHFPVERKPTINDPVKKNNQFIIQHPLASPPPPVPADAKGSTLAAELESIVSNPIPSSSRASPHRTNSAGPCRVRANASGLIRTTPRPTESNITVPQRAQSLHSNCAAPSTLADFPVEANTVAQLPITNDNIENSVHEPQIITEGAGNYGEEEEQIVNTSREKSLTVPDDPIENPVKQEPMSSSQMEVDQGAPPGGYMDEEMETENQGNDSNTAQYRIQPLPSSTAPILPSNAFADNQPETKYDPTITKFYRPSDKPLEDACKILGFNYDGKAYSELWSTLKIKFIKSKSDSIKSGQKLDGFDCLALFLTGDSMRGRELLTNVNLKLSKDESLRSDFTVEQLYNMSHTFCDEHFYIVSKWIKCRIGIFVNGQLSQRYGSWNGNESDELIILIEKNGSTYAPILEL